MKKLLLIAMLFSLNAEAKVIAESANKGGGKIVLTDEYCNDGSHKLAYSQMSGYPTLMGCWATDESFVHVRWYDGDLRSYPYSNWVLKNPAPNT